MEALETCNTMAYPLTDSRHSADGRAHLTGRAAMARTPSCPTRDCSSTGWRAAAACYIGSAGAYTTAYASSL